MHCQLRMRTTVPFGKKTMLSTFHIEKVINDNKELFTRHLLRNYLIFKPKRTKWTITITTTTTTTIIIIIIEHSTRWLVLSTDSRSNWNQECQFLSREKNRKTWRKPLEQGRESNPSHSSGRRALSPPTPRSPFFNPNELTTIL